MRLLFLDSWGREDLNSKKALRKTAGGSGGTIFLFYFFPGVEYIGITKKEKRKNK